MKGFIFLEKDPKLPWTVYVGAAGMPGKTAYMGWKEFSHAKKVGASISAACRR
jgi:NADPH-dependent curcumin reductase CurA